MGGGRGGLARDSELEVCVCVSVYACVQSALVTQSSIDKQA